MTDPQTLPRVVEIASNGTSEDHVALTYEGRFLRRKRIVSAGGLAFMVDLSKATSLADGAVLVLDTGQRIAVLAASEPLIEVRGPLPRLAWHIGNRHTPCQIKIDHLRILDDHVLAGMLRGLGAELTPITGPFTPEGGAYGLGRTMPHDHGPAAEHQHSHAHDGHEH